jgi:hypothetical protein
VRRPTGTTRQARTREKKGWERNKQPAIE